MNYTVIDEADTLSGHHVTAMTAPMFSMGIPQELIWNYEATADGRQRSGIVILLVCLLVSNTAFLRAQESPQPVTQDAQVSTVDRMIVRRGIRIDLQADLTPTRHPVIEIELYSERLFDGHNQIVSLRVGSHEFTNYSGNFVIHQLIFELTPQEFQRTRTGDQVVIKYGPTNPIEDKRLLRTWRFGRLHKDQVSRNAVRTFTGSSIGDSPSYSIDGKPGQDRPVNKQPIGVSVQSTDVPGLKKLLAQDPSIPASCRTRIVLARALLAQHAPSQELVEAAGNNFCGPDPLLYWDLAAELNEREEYLGEALQYATWSARRYANDAIGQLNPALLIASIQIKRGELDLVISSLSKSRESDSGAFAWLGLAYEKTDQIDRATEAYIQSVGAQEIWSTIPPQGERRSMRPPEFNLEEMYRKRYGSLEGLAARIKTARRAAFHVMYVHPFRIKNPTFQWTLYDLNSGYVSLANYLGRIVVLCFVPTEYEPVLYELKHLQTLSEKYKEGEVVFLVVDVHLEKFPSATRRQDVAKALIKAGITLPATMEVFDTVRKCYMLTGVGGPTSGVVIIDSTHTQAFLTGGISQEYVPRITKILDYLLEEPLVRPK